MNENMWEKQTLQIPRSVEKQGDVLQAPEKRFTCSPWWEPWWGRPSPYCPWRLAVEQMQPIEPPMPEQEYAQSRLWLGGKPVLEQAPGKTCGPMKRRAQAEAGAVSEYFDNVYHQKSVFCWIQIFTLKTCNLQCNVCDLINNYFLWER